MPAKSDPLEGLAPGVILQGVAEAVATPVPRPSPSTVARPEEEYPDTDGKPMAENTWQAATMRYAGDALTMHFEGRGLVATDLLIYYRKGDRRATVAPDVMVVLGVDGSHRRTYRMWEEGGRAPDFVLEVISSTTQENDEGRKRRTYAQLGVREYFRYSPVSRRMAGMGGHRLVGEVLREGRWEALPRLAKERIRSAVLGLELRVRERDTGGGFRELRFFDPVTGKDLQTYAEQHQGQIRAERARRESERARRGERQGRIRAERENARLRAMLEQLSGAGAGDAPSDGT